MSIEAAKVFMATLVADQELLKKAKICKNVDERVALAHSAGYDFTASEFRNVVYGYMEFKNGQVK